MYVQYKFRLAKLKAIFVSEIDDEGFYFKPYYSIFFYLDYIIKLKLVEEKPSPFHFQIFKKHIRNINSQNKKR